MKSKHDQSIPPQDAAFNKTYFVNLFTKDIVCHDFIAAKLHYPRLAAIAEALSDTQLQYLIDKIETLL